jgi:alpha-beta hydrolase superfamily lysophospholipase
LKGEQLSRDPAVGEAYFSDPLVYRKSTPRLGAALFESMDALKESAAELDVPTLVLHGTADTIVPPQSTAILGELACVERRARNWSRTSSTGSTPGSEPCPSHGHWPDSTGS